ncbi:MAG: hypothetical protein Q4A27_03475 [bacterium]|nr:hypothetical protein [bacterium]
MTTEKLTLAFEETEEVIEIGFAELQKLQNREKSLKSAFVQDLGSISKTRIDRGARVALKARYSELDTVSEEIEFFESQLEDALECVRSLDMEIAEMAFPSIEREKLEDLRDFANREIIPELSQNIRDLRSAKAKVLSRVASVRKTTAAAKKHGRRMPNVLEKPYKRNRAVARTRRNAEKYAFLY